MKHSRFHAVLTLLLPIVCACGEAMPDSSRGFSSESSSGVSGSTIAASSEDSSRSVPFEFTFCMDGLYCSNYQPNFCEAGKPYDLWYDYSRVEFYQRTDVGWIRLDRHAPSIPMEEEDAHDYFWRPVYIREFDAKSVLTRAFIRTLYGANATFDSTISVTDESRDDGGKVGKGTRTLYENVHSECDVTDYFWDRKTTKQSWDRATGDWETSAKYRTTFCAFVEDGIQRSYVNGVYQDLAPYEPHPDDVHLPFDDLAGGSKCLSLLLSNLKDATLQSDGRFHFEAKRSFEGVDYEAKADFALGEDGLSVADIHFLGSETACGVAADGSEYAKQRRTFEASVSIRNRNATVCEIPASYRTLPKEENA